MTKVASGYLQPVVVGDLDHATVDTIYDVCPGTRVDGPPEYPQDPATVDLVWGVWRRMALGWAADPTVRHRGSTGGALTALAQYLLATERVEFVLHVRASTVEPAFGEPTLSFSDADVLDGAGSRYGPTAPLLGVRDVLDLGRPFAFIGKPCDIGALRNWARHDPRVDDLVRYCLTPVCGGFGTPAFTRNFLDRIDIDPEAVTALRYRGNGCPGPTRVETVDRVVEQHYLDYWGDDATQWSLPWRCKICPDGIGETADIAASDAWPGGAPTREGSVDDPGTNALIARTAAGQELLEAAERDGALVIEREIGPAEMSVYQPHQVRKKIAVAPRLLGIADEGRIVPRYDRLRLDELVAEQPVEINEAQRHGTRERIRMGKATEPAPRLP